jgi:hypothetical protein
VHATLLDDENFPGLPQPSIPSSDRAVSRLRIGTTLGKTAKHDTSMFELYPKMPFEIRAMIIEEVMRAGGHFDRDILVQIHSYNSKSSSRPTFLPAICFSSKATFMESTPVFIRNATWKFTGYAGARFLFHFLSSIPDGKGFMAVRNSNFTALYWFDGVEAVDTHTNADMELMARCPRLSKVGFSLHLLMFMHDSDDDLAPWEYAKRMKTVPEIVNYYDFEKIFNCTHLKEIVINGIQVPLSMDYSGGNAEHRLRDLADWLKSEFKSRLGKNVKVTIEWNDWSH